MQVENMQKRKKILLVEDSRLTAMVVAGLLNKNGYETETAVTGEEAVQKISGGSLPDLVLMDIELAGKMDGIDAARRILKSRDIPVIFLTANASREILENIKAVKGYGFVVKGSDKYALLSTVEMALKLHEANTHARMFERLFENSLNELYIFHPKSLKYVAVNRAARKNLGYTIEELNTMIPLDLKPEFDIESFQKILNPLVSGEQEQVLFNTVHRRKDGSLYPVEINLQLFDYGGEKLCLALVVDLTERRAMEEELKEKETTLSAIMGSAREAIVMLDGQGNVIFWNPAAELLFGYSREEILGKDLHRLVVPDECLYQAYNKAFKHFQLTGEGKAVGKTMELKTKHKDGRELDVELSLSALRFRNAWHAVGIVRDISERKQAQEELENSRKQYLELAENAPIGILKCDQEGNIIYVNQKTLEMLGSPSIEETKKINLLTFPLLVRYGLSRKLEECLQNNKPGTYEMNYESKWGKKVWLRVHIKPQVDRNTVIGAQIIIDDITERKQLEEVNRRKEERFRLMLEGIPNPAWLVSRKRRILAQNKAASALFGTKVGDYCWKRVLGGGNLPDEYREAYEKNGSPLPGTKCYFCRGDEALAGNKPLNSEVELGGNIWDMWWIPLGEDVYLHYATDVTRYKKIEEELRQLSVTDVLTNAYNRRYFTQKLEEEIERAKRADRKFSLIILDIDRFKSINDRFGHNAGDLVLKSIAELIKNRIRKIDTLARWGGEEFVILLPDTTVKNAARLAEELRESLSQMDIPGVDHVTASFGVAGYCPGDMVDTLVNKADNMMYEAKAAGRNCVRYMNECE
ncbi:response regulator receiver modulated diguanylate cyclase with PAS/PAC sensor [Desulfotomaculum nigrificans CO-1-SRB]|uniref:Stage 0 sporulation protein A homolog n=1 Tax=Desulfotomaculum nigrificans (strain DSM 14880 / VKM B-2319 / CO-1-SRB) TaxID=868595 RepID=F6B735_DESCC|nr:PAS domain S-box protein [Desulfotomaculum nigrificans]AEF94460.1 response regulator receiver modulated diguanylate cyclase with PAS/PAC sensor [Desulfotomaculum nigrificans CO-1-SRB]